MTNTDTATDTATDTMTNPTSQATAADRHGAERQDLLQALATLRGFLRQTARGPARSRPGAGRP